MLFPVRGQWARPTNERRDGRSPDSPINASWPPSRSSLQWLIGRKLPDYSCGYSLGISPSSLLAVLWTAPSGCILGTSARRCQLSRSSACFRARCRGAGADSPVGRRGRRAGHGWPIARSPRFEPRHGWRGEIEPDRAVCTRPPTNAGKTRAPDRLSSRCPVPP